MGMLELTDLGHSISNPSAPLSGVMIPSGQSSAEHRSTRRWAKYEQSHIIVFLYTNDVRNGRTGGITHPSPEGQEAVVRKAYANAGGLDPDLTGYFECHGTGKPSGDPIEVSAIGRVFEEVRRKDPLLIGSVSIQRRECAVSWLTKGLDQNQFGT